MVTSGLHPEGALQLDVRTIYLMFAVLYLMLHGIIWFSLSRYQSRFVRSWSIAGIVSASGIGLLSFQGVLPEWVVAVCGQMLMAAGNLGRLYVLRCLGETPTSRWVWGHGLFHMGYLVVNGTLFVTGASHRDMMVVFFLFYALSCLEFFFAGRKIGQQRQTSGAVTVQLGGLVFTVSLAIKTIALLMGWGAQGLYDPGWDQVALFAMQILALSLLNFGFMQILVDQFQQERSQAENALLLQRERAAQAERQSQALVQALRERQEIIRQLTLSSKTAGMGALVSGMAHEISQPLTSIVLKSELIEGCLAEPLDLQQVHALCSKIRDDTHHAGAMIRTLRNMFAMGRSGFEPFDFVAFLHEVIGIVRTRMERLGVALELDLPETLQITGDRTQLQQVVLNLLNNAMQAIEQQRAAGNLLQARISVGCRCHDGLMALQVTDNGCGIAPELRDDVFALFKSPHARGMGIGLWLSQSVVESHGGTLDFESAPGEGAVFLLHLPASKNAVQDPVRSSHEHQ